MHYFNKINEVLVRQEKEVQNVLNVHVYFDYRGGVKSEGTRNQKETHERTNTSLLLYLCIYYNNNTANDIYVLKI